MGFRSSLSIGILLIMIAPVPFQKTALALDHDERIPLDSAGSGVPANDLQLEGRPLNPEEAWQLTRSGKLNLADLDPVSPDGLWTPNAATAQEEALPDLSGAQEFLGVIASREGDLRFNFRGPDGKAPIMTALLSKTAHSVLLNRALLRRLGYRIPRIEHREQLRIRFPSPESKRLFLETQIPKDTYGAASRWLVKNAAMGDDLEASLQDVLVMRLEPDSYNLALAAPVSLSEGGAVQPLTTRELRALIVPYSLADLGESVNQFSWAVGRIDDGAVLLPTSLPEDFSCTIDDARWILRRIMKLGRADFESIAQESALPEAVTRVVSEKLVARRNSLMKLFNVDTTALPFDTKISDPPDLRGGKLVRREWPGYASRFAYGDADSPVRGLGYLALSVAESNAITNLIAKADEEIPRLGESDQARAHAQDLFTKTLVSYILYGTPARVPKRVWHAPLAGGGVSISRELVIGSYLGTNNLVQLADTVGVTASAGVLLGLDGMPGFLGVSGIAQGSFGLSFAHLKPLSKLKSAVTEPIRNIIVPWLQLRTAHRLDKLVAAQKYLSSETDETKPATDLLNELKKDLGIGESLIMTMTFSANESIQAQAGLSHAPVPSGIGEIGLNQLVLSRTHVFRKDADTIQVFRDHGELGGLQLAAELTLGSLVPFPVFSASLSDQRGLAKIDVSQLDIDSDPERNPSLAANAAALSALLKTGSMERIRELAPPTELKLRFNDSSSSLAFFHWRKRGLKANGRIAVRSPEGETAQYLSLSEGSQTGKHYQSLATDAASYLVERLTQGNGSVQTMSAQDPGQSFLGSSRTRDVSLQARITGKDGSLANPMVRFAHRWRGWRIRAKDAEKLLNELNGVYHFEFYPSTILEQLKSIQLYEIHVGLDVHWAGLQKLAGIAPEPMKELVSRHGKLHHCELYPSGLQQMSGEDIHACASIDGFQQAWKHYQERTRKPLPDSDKLAHTLLTLCSKAEAFLPFEELRSLLGGDENLYLYSSITGFRKGSENPSGAIESNRLGRSQGVRGMGPVDELQAILGIETGEFNAQWIREIL